jgi:hypothetical protein
MFNLGSKKDYVMLGNKRVTVPKLTRKRLKKLTDHIGSIGDYLIKLFLTPESDRAVFIVSDLPIDYLDEHAAFGECTEFLRLTWEKNDMNEALKNLNGLIPPVAQQFIQSIVKRMDRADV